jgi:hypothetical protein
VWYSVKDAYKNNIAWGSKHEQLLKGFDTGYLPVSVFRRTLITAGNAGNGPVVLQ